MLIYQQIKCFSNYCSFHNNNMLHPTHGQEQLSRSDLFYFKSPPKKVRSGSKSETLTSPLDYKPSSLHPKHNSYISSITPIPIRTPHRYSSPQVVEESLQSPTLCNFFEENGGEVGGGFGFHYDSLEDLCS